MDYWAESVAEHQNVYCTPNFLTHFDLRGIEDPDALWWRVAYSSLMLGFCVKKGHTGDINIQEDPWVSNVKYKCNVGGGPFYRS